MKLTLAITVFNRYELLLESFAQVIDDPRIDEVLIMDDCSKDEYWNKIKELPKFNDKIKVVRQLENRGMSVNKRDAIFNAKNEWVIIFDSDNVIGKDYLDALFLNGQFMADSVINSPEYASPNFNFKNYSEKFIDKNNAKIYLNDEMFRCFLNCCNYVVHREKYLDCFEYNPSVSATDTINFNYLWLKKGRSFYIVPGCRYTHRVHKGSGFLENIEYNMSDAKNVENKIMAL